MEPAAAKLACLPRTEVRQGDQNQASGLQEPVCHGEVLEWLDDVFERMAEDHRVVAAGPRRPACKRPLLALETALPCLGDCFRGRLEPGHPPPPANEHNAEVA